MIPFQVSIIEQNLKTLQQTEESTPGNAAIIGDYNAMLTEISRLEVNAEPEGDGGLWALHRLHEYFHENGNYKARQLIDDAAHRAGFCLADGGTEVLLEGNWCPVCMSELPNA